MGLKFNQEPAIGDLAHGLNQLDFAQRPRNYRFEIIADPGLREAVQGFMGRPMHDFEKGIVEQIDLAINPQQYQVQEPTRQGVTQTVSGAWVDFYGLGLPKITMSGTTGWNPRRRSRSLLSNFPLLDSSRAARLQRYKTLRGQIEPSTPTGLHDFVALRNRVFRTYAVLLQRLNIDFSSRLQSRLQLRFYAWDTEDYFIVLMDQFELRRNAARPLLYDYSIQMTVIGYPDSRRDISDYLRQYYAPKERLGGVLSQFKKWQSMAGAFKQAVQDVSKDVSLAITSVTGRIDKLATDIESILTDVQDAFVSTPFAALKQLTTDMRDLGESVTELTQLPVRFKEDFRNQLLETTCAVEGLKTYKKLFERPFSGVFGDVPWANLTCSSTLGIPPNPTSAELGMSLPLSTDKPVFSALTDVSVPGAPVSVSGLRSNSQASQDVRIKEVILAEGDSLESAILKSGGLDQDVAQVWQQVATLNGLEYPYVAPNASFQAEVLATGVVSFSGTAGTTIPLGTRVATTPATEDGESAVFKTQAAVMIPASGRVSVSILAEKPGAFANVKPLEIDRVLNAIGDETTIPGVAVVENSTATEGGRVYRVLKPGQKLKIPVVANSETRETFLERRDSNEENLFGNDLFLDEGGDFSTDARGDLLSVRGIKNMEVSVLDRLQTDQGSLTKHPSYGMNTGRLVGEPGDSNALVVARLELKAALLQDPRIKSVDDMTVLKIDDALDVSMNLVLIDEVRRPTAATLPITG